MPLGLQQLTLLRRYSKLLIDLYEKFKTAETLLAEQILRLENIWLRTKEQLDFLRTIASTLDVTHLRIQEQNLDVLGAKLKVATSKIEGLVEQDTDGLKVKRFKFAVVKDGLDKTIEELELWQKLFDPSWFLIMKLANSSVDNALQISQSVSNTQVIQSAHQMRLAVTHSSQAHSARIFLPESGLELANTIAIPGSNTKLVQRVDSNKWLLIEDVSSSTTVTSSAHEKDVREIARRLSHVTPADFNLLNCYGVVRRYSSGGKHPSSYTFVFRYPEHVLENDVRSLREVLQAQDVEHPLSDRFRIAQDLARAVSYVHSFGFVHKNVRPETILLLKDTSVAARSNDRGLGTPFLVGLDAFRSAEGKTARVGDTKWSLNVYRHPSRQGERPVEDYVMQHDIYSLGVCLLELGIFETFVLGPDTDPVANPVLLDLPVTALSTNPAEIKQHLVDLARRELPKKMGTKYTDIVITCLTCLDEDNVDFGDEAEFQDEDGIAVNVRYIEKVLGKLNDISV